MQYRCCLDAYRHPAARRSQAGLPAIASTGVHAFAFTLGVLALLRMSVFTYFVE